MHASSGNGEWTDGTDAAALLAARLTEAAYEVALRHGTRGSFADLELELWRRIRSVVAAGPTFGRAAAHGDGA